MYNRCILTIVEENDYYPNTASMFVKTLTNADIPIHEIEKILINIALLIIANKIFGLLVITHYSSYIKKYTSII
jgi:hypothetical protein